MLCFDKVMKRPRCILSGKIHLAYQRQTEVQYDHRLSILTEQCTVISSFKYSTDRLLYRERILHTLLYCLMHEV